MSRRHIVGAAWSDYARRVLPANVSEVQRRETRLAFYAGALSLFAGIMSMLDPGLEATENDLEKMDDLKAEFDEFKRDLAGAAARSRS